MLNSLGWTEERERQLRELWLLGASCSQIAGKIGGISRNAVIGKANRLGLERRKKGNSTGQKRARKPRAWKPKAEVSDLFANSLPPADFLGVSWVEAVDAKTCMYPEGDGANMMFCGQPRADESSYCGFHHRVCHTAARVPIMKYWRAA